MRGATDAPAGYVKMNDSINPTGTVLTSNNTIAAL